MKKSKIVLGKKLFLTKDKITPLNDQQANDVVGGATELGCMQTFACVTEVAGCTQPSALCPPLSRLIACFTNRPPSTPACLVCR